MMLAYQPIRALATINIAINQGSATFKRIVEVIDKDIQITNQENLPNLNISNSNIKFKNVEFKYLSTKSKALHNINLDIQGGSMSAFVVIVELEKVQLLIFCQDFMTLKMEKFLLMVKILKR